LVATDIAARGIDIDELSHVINFEIPNIPETYIHRIGRTGRAGLSGIAISLCDQEEKAFLKDIHKLISMQIPVIENHPYLLTEWVWENSKQLVNKADVKKNKFARTTEAPSTNSRRRRRGTSKVWTNTGRG
jgi:ATP-dependent RNA helicase RhlE